MSDLPKYQLIINDIKQKILNNTYKVDDKLPTENELADIYGVSRMTVNKALIDLEKDNYVYKIQGSGTYVKRRTLNKKFGSSVSFTNDISSSGSIPSSKLLEFRYCNYDEFPIIFKGLNLNENDNLIFFKRLRFSNNNPVAISLTFVSPKIVRNIDINELNNSFYDYILNKYNIKPICKNYTVSACMANSSQKKWLNTDETALLKVSHYSYTQNGNPFEYNETFYLSDKFTYTTNGETFGIESRNDK